MSQAKITLIGLENYLNPERSVFDNMVLPDGIDKDTLIGSIIMRCQEFELLYSDPDFMISLVNVWSRKHYRTFDKWVKALDIEYDPLFNYDRTEEYTDTHTGKYDKSIDGTISGSNSRSEDFTRTDNLTQSDDHTRTDNLTQSDDHTRTDNLTQSDDHTRTDNLASTNDVTTTHTVSAYNSSAYEPKDQEVVDQDTSNTGTQRNAGTTTNTGTQRTAGTTSNTGTQREAGTTSNTGTQRNAGSASDTYSDTNDTDESGNDSWTNIHKARLFGNIGVTTSQQMLQSELDVARWNLYEHIADLFCTEFCIMVY